MKHDLFEFSMEGMTTSEITWRVVFLLICIAIAVADLFVWRPG